MKIKHVKVSQYCKSCIKTIANCFFIIEVKDNFSQKDIEEQLKLKCKFKKCRIHPDEKICITYKYEHKQLLES